MRLRIEAEGPARPERGLCSVARDLRAARETGGAVFFPHEAWPAEMRDRLTGVTPDWRSRDLGAERRFGVRVP